MSIETGSLNRVLKRGAERVRSIRGGVFIFSTGGVPERNRSRKRSNAQENGSLAFGA